MHPSEPGNTVIPVQTIVQLYPAHIFQQHLVQSVSIYGNKVYEPITKFERTNPNARNPISNVENMNNS